MTQRWLLLLKSWVCLCLFVCPQSGKGNGYKNSRAEVLWAFYAPPTLGINCHEGGWVGEKGGVVTVKKKKRKTKKKRQGVEGGEWRGCCHVWGNSRQRPVVPEGREDRAVVEKLEKLWIQSWESPAIPCACVHVVTHSNFQTQLQPGEVKTRGHSEEVGKDREGDTPEWGDGVVRHQKSSRERGRVLGVHALTSGSTSALLLQMFSHTNLSCRFYKHAEENGALARTRLSDHPLLGLLPPSPSFSFSLRRPVCPANGHAAWAWVGRDLWPPLCYSKPLPVPNSATWKLSCYEGAPRVTQEPFQCDKLLHSRITLSSRLSLLPSLPHIQTLASPPLTDPHPVRAILAVVLLLWVMQHTASPLSLSVFPPNIPLVLSSLPCTPPQLASPTMGSEWLNCLWWSERQGSPLNPNRGMNSLSLVPIFRSSAAFLRTRRQLVIGNWGGWRVLARATSYN